MFPQMTEIRNRNKNPCNSLPTCPTKGDHIKINLAVVRLVAIIEINLIVVSLVLGSAHLRLVIDQLGQIL